MKDIKCFRAPYKLCSPSFSQISDDRDYKTVLCREECVGPHFTVWIIVVYAFHSLLLIFGLFLAFETRKISIPALNDSRLIGISVYNVVMLCAVGVPVSFFTNSHPTVSFSLICAVILFCTTLTLGILFVPKVRTPVFKISKLKSKMKRHTLLAKHSGREKCPKIFNVPKFLSASEIFTAEYTS